MVLLIQTAGHADPLNHWNTAVTAGAGPNQAPGQDDQLHFPLAPARRRPAEAQAAVASGRVMRFISSDERGDADPGGG